MKADQAYRDLLKQYREITLLQGAHELIAWDQEVLMPEKGENHRGEMMGTLAAQTHQLKCDKMLKSLVDTCKKAGFKSREKSRNTNLIAKVRRRSTALPESLVREMSETESRAYQVWVKARKAGSYKLFAPWLDKLIAQKRKVIKLLGEGGDPYDTLLDDYEPDTKSSDITPVFDDLQCGLVDLLKRIKKSKVKPNLRWFKSKYPIQEQRAFSQDVISAMEFDFKAGRLDEAVHPFTSTAHPGDIRLTTRFSEKDPCDGITSSMHEAGHGLYEQNLPLRWYGQPIGEAVSLGIHESQSRLWENIIGRSENFWRHWFPKLKKRFPKQLSGAKLSDWYLLMNRVAPSFIRVEADEVTYNLHILLRFQIEREIFNDGLKSSMLEKRWNELCRQYLGITPKNPSQGILQDVHWSMGLFGYFPTYSLGNLYSAHFYRQAAQVKGIESAIKKGKYGALKNWLVKNIHDHGSRFTPGELLHKVSKENLSARPFLDYLLDKYGKLYRLD